MGAPGGVVEFRGFCGARDLTSMGKLGRKTARARAKRVGRNCHEAHVSTVQHTSKTDARLPKANQHSKGDSSDCPQACEGSEAACSNDLQEVSGESSRRARGAGVGTTADLGIAGVHPRQARVRKRGDFLRIQKDGVRVRTNAFTVVALRHELGGRARLGCAVRRGVGAAPLRNRVRRLIKETFRRIAARLPSADFVVIAGNESALRSRAGLAAVARELAPALSRAGVLVSVRGS